MPSRRDRYRFGTAGEDHDGQRAVEEGDGRGEKTRVSDIVGERRNAPAADGFARSLISDGAQMTKYLKP